MDLGLTGKIALVTGSGRGIGRAVAEALWAEGCSVAINARDSKSLQAMVQEWGNRASMHPADVTNSPACRRLIDDVISRWGRLDIIVCNVGDGASVPPGRETGEEWQRMF